MVSAIPFGWFADFGKTLTIIQQLSQPVYSGKWKAPLFFFFFQVRPRRMFRL